MVLLIGLCGKMGSGKDFITNNYIVPYLQRHGKSHLQLSFADQIKVNVMTKMDVRFDDVYVTKNHESRKLLQLEGTEHGRRVLGEDIWINYHKSWVEVFGSRGIDVVIVSDVRFQNEAKYIKTNGGILIKIDAPTRTEKRLQQESNADLKIYNQIKSHASECDLDNFPKSFFDIIIYNDPGHFEISSKVHNHEFALPTISTSVTEQLNTIPPSTFNTFSYLAQYLDKYL